MSWAGSHKLVMLTTQEVKIQDPKFTVLSGKLTRITFKIKSKMGVEDRA